MHCSDYDSTEFMYVIKKKNKEILNSELDSSQYEREMKEKILS